jgi:Cu/Ag efflux pump CusA
MNGAVPQRTLMIVIVVAIGILLLLEESFRSWRLAFVSVCALLMALSGGVLAAFLDGRVLTLGSLFGFLTVFGIAVRQMVIMARRVHYLAEQNGAIWGPEIVQRAASERLVPLVMTLVTVAIAILPLVFFGDIAGHEIIRPMATVILGGLVTTILLNLFVMPAVFVRIKFSPKPAIVFPHLESSPDFDLSRV